MASDAQTTNPATTAAPTESVTSLVTGILGDAERLLKQQFRMLKHEVREDLRKTAAASMSMAAGGLVLLYGVLLLLFALPLLLATYVPAVPLWAWFAIVGAVVTVAGACLLYAGKKKFDSFNPLPDETAEALKENVQWITKPK